METNRPVLVRAVELGAAAFRWILCLGVGLFAARVSLAMTAPSLPPEILSHQFSLTVNGAPMPVAHAAAGYSFANFDLAAPAEIAITAPSDDYWARGVEVQPWRHGLRPVRHGRTITFTLEHPAKLSVSRPGDHRAGADMLFLFANTPEPDAPRAGDPGVRYYGPGVHHEDIAVKSGETVYLAAGSVVFGSLNVWEAQDARILGRGIVIHDGPQNPTTDEGWQHRPNWHAITMHNARNIVVRGITCVVRSRTWMIQLQGSKDLRFEDLKVIGGTQGNANQDGIDWLGCGDTVVRDCFFRCSDDVFALYGNTGFYDAAISIPGLDVRNILIEDCVLSTSISNIVRVGWPGKVFNSGNFTLRNCDVIHMGPGGCIVPFALAELWGEPGSQGTHSDYLFEDIRLDDWYSLAQLRQPATGAGISNVVFRNIWALDQPALVPSVMLGNVAGVRFENIRIGDRTVAAESALPLDRHAPTTAPEFTRGPGPCAAFGYSPGAIAPGMEVTFDASASAAGSGAGRIASYEWRFGDSTSATGAVVRHAFPDSLGTALDGSGRFRVILQVTDAAGRTDAIARPVVVTTTLREPGRAAGGVAGLVYRYFVGAWDRLPDFSALTPAAAGAAPGLDFTVRQATDNYAIVFEGYLQAPVDGGYTFVLVGKDGGRLEIADATVVESPAPLPQPCNTVGNTAQCATGTIGLKAGWHHFRLSVTDTFGPDAIALKWQGPGIALEDIPPTAFGRGE
jgi:hypothetical protein